MDGHIWLLIVFFGFFVLVGGFFAAAESAFSALNLIRVRSMADDGDKRAKKAVFLYDRFEKTLTTLLICINLSHIAAATLATLIATAWFGESDLTTMLTTFVTTLIVFFVSEMIPKSFANDRSEEYALFCAPLLCGCCRVFAPLTAFFTALSHTFTKWFRKEEQPTISEDELYDIIDTIEEEGVVNEEQSDLLKSALEFGDTTVSDVMTMRGDIQMLDVSLPARQAIEVLQTYNHSRIPVYEGTPDRILGVLPIRRFLKAYLRSQNVSIRTLMLEPFFVSEEAKIDDLLDEMRQHKKYLAVVRDVEGHTLGIVTIEDFLEELVGEIWDEDDVYDRNFINLGGNRFDVNPHMPVRDAFRHLGINIPGNYAAKQSLASWVKQYYNRTRGNTPEEDDSFTYQGVEIEVQAVKDGRVTEIVLHRLGGGADYEEVSV